jgi:hypothetical protein
MAKAFINRWKQRDKPEDDITDFWFTSNPESAACWETKEHAESECTLFDLFSIKIPTAEGGTYVCRGFRTEGRKSGEFVIFCEGPFVAQQQVGRSLKEK